MLKVIDFDALEPTADDGENDGEFYVVTLIGSDNKVIPGTATMVAIHRHPDGTGSFIRAPVFQIPANTRVIGFRVASAAVSVFEPFSLTTTTAEQINLHSILSASTMELLGEI